MASACLILTVIASISIFNVCFASRILTTTSVKDPQGQQLLQYHNGPLLRGEITVNLIWYGDFTVPQRAIVADFITSLSASSPKTAESQQPSVAAWLKIVENHYYHLSGARKSNSVSLLLGKQVRDVKYSLGKSLSQKQIVDLASKGGLKNAVNVVLTAKDVAVDGFCVNRCGTHGYKNVHVKGKYSKFAYVWVGNSETRCPGLCAWPFHQPMYGPQVAPLIAPNNDVGLDGIIMSLSGLLAGTVTNPFGNGYYQGSREAPLEAATACTGVYGKGAYPGYPGKLLVDHQTGASYNAHGANGRKYLLPALFDPSTSTCSTLL